MNNNLNDVLARLLGLSDAPLQPGDEVIRARLAALLAAEETATETLTTEPWSAYLSGHMEPEARAAVQRQIAASPALVHEAISLAQLLEEVEADPARIPADLAAEASVVGRRAFGIPEMEAGLGLRGSLAAMGLQGGLVSGVRGALEIILGQGRQACEIVLKEASNLIKPDPGAWSFAAVPALVTRSSSSSPAVVEGVREADAASMTVIADRFEGVRRIEVVIRGVSPEQAPTVLVADEEGTLLPVRRSPSVEAKGSVRLLYEFEDLPAGRYVVLICEPAASPDAK